MGLQSPHHIVTNIVEVEDNKVKRILDEDLNNFGATFIS